MGEDSQQTGNDAANQSQDWLTRGDELAEQKCLEEALLAYERAIHLDPQNARAHHAKGVVLGKLARHNAALAAFEQAIRFKPDRASTLSNKGFALSQLGRYDEALASYDAVIHLDPSDASIWLKKGDVLADIPTRCATSVTGSTSA
ncbi:MAG: tetratricopeptide repeat protein [Ktedonobacteraceae bacterium]